MTISQMKIGTFAVRDTQYEASYCVKKTGHFTHYYYDIANGVAKKANQVRQDSTIRDHSDFKYCDEHGRIIQNKTKEKEMNKNVDYVGGEYKVVKVDYEFNNEFSTKFYNFKMDIDTKVKEGDLLVAESSNGLAIVKCIEIIENNIKNAMDVKKAKAWIVDKIDYSRQKKRKKATERREYIIQQLEERKAQVDEINMYQMLANMDPTAAKLVEELKQLS